MKQQQKPCIAQYLKQISPRIISTSFGNIYSLSAGTPGQPLILVVHGSGPNNSSDQYSYLVHQYYFYVVAIDCPGYGKSQGSKQVVKIFPLKMFEEILKQLNYTSCYAMLGHSQGAAAIFNAVLKSPKITQFLVMDRPICGNVQRFMGFSLPTLLIYDIEDQVRPISQGKLLYKWLKYAQLYTYRSSTHQFWPQNQIWFKMLNFFSKDFEIEPKYHQEIKLQNTINQGQRQRQRQRININQQYKREKSYSLGGGLQRKGKQLQNFKGIQISLIGKPIMLQQRVRAQKFHSFKNDQNPQSSSKKHRYKQKYVKVVDKVEIEKPVNKPRQIMKEQQIDQYKCAICYQILFKPIITNCKHRFCSKCMMESFLINQRCPLCRAKITKKIQNIQLHQKLLLYFSNYDIIRRERQYKRVEAMVKTMVNIQIGNNAQLVKTKKSIFTKTSKKYNWQFFVKQPKNFQIQEVQLNLNIDDQDSKPIKIRNKPFTFESRSIYSFDCQVTIRPKNKEYPDIVEIYFIDVFPGTHSKVIPLKKKCYMK